ncbi:hypothetical protein [Corynebacterium sp.]|uniref:phage tail tube protein n=1 Tax=Corynebacterium sp. TaxID=1720 RepID=UPI0028A711A6|nr:hypothetical protein [Corynebacterium sp.]
MAINVQNTFVGRPDMDGGVYFRAPLGTALPTTSTDKLNEAFEDHGAVGEDGFAVTPTRNNTDIRMMGGDVLRTVQTEFGVEMVLTLLEDDTEAVTKTVFGDTKVETSTVQDGDTTRKVYYSADPLPISTHILKAVDGNKTNLYIAERGQVVSVGERRIAHSDVTRTEITIRAYKPTSPAMKGANVLELRHSKAEPTQGGGTGGGEEETGGEG